MGIIFSHTKEYNPHIDELTTGMITEDKPDDTEECKLSANSILEETNNKLADVDNAIKNAERYKSKAIKCKNEVSALLDELQQKKTLIEKAIQFEREIKSLSLNSAANESEQTNKTARKINDLATFFRTKFYAAI